MKLTLILLLVASSQAAKVANARTKDRIEDFEKEKRERNSGLEKRTPLLPTVSSSASPGVEYAGTKEIHSDQSPSQQIYATPVPQISKISDVLAQGGPFQAAIANQLYSPVPVYQSRFPTYEVSRPVPSQLAYAEHSIQPQNIQSIPKANLPANYQPQIFQQYETSAPQQIPANYQRTTSAISNQPINYQQPLIQYQQYIPEQVQYAQEAIQPQAAYRQELPVTYQTEQAPQNIQQAYTTQPSQGAFSYASYAQNQRDQVAQNQQQSQYQPQPPQLIKYQLQHQPIQYQGPYTQPPQQQYQLQQYEAPQFQINQQPYQQYQQSEAKVQYQPQLPPLQIQPYQPQYGKSNHKSEKQVYLKQLQQPAVIQQIQPQFQAQPAQTKLSQQYKQVPAQNLGHDGKTPLPTFPPVQYFGKFAHSIFGQQ